MPSPTSSITPEARCAQVLALLQPLADGQRAEGMQAYMRGRFTFFGIQTPARRAATLPWLRACKGMPADQLLAIAGLLWAQPQRECHYVAADLLARHQAALGMGELQALLDLVQRQSWWDTVDTLAGVVGDVLRRERKRRPEAQGAMDDALRHVDLWVRRVAMLHQLGWRSDTDRARLFAYAEALAPETEFFIRKAIGWALRDFARHDPVAVAAFLQRMGDRLSGLSRREAGKHIFAREA